MKQFNDIYVGLDVHKDTIAVAVARGLRTKPVYFGEIPNTPAAIVKLLHQLSPDGEVLNFCYEAGPCGYEVYHQLTKLGQSCAVVAPSLIPRMPGVRGWSLEPVLNSLMAMRGVNTITAVTLLAELGDITRFDNPKQLMSYLGLVPSEHSSGGKRQQGSITKTGNGHVRRVLVEAAWNYRFPARKSRTIEMRAEKTSDRVQAIAWEGQKRLCGRYKKLLSLGKLKQKVCTAVAREMVGFVWAIACEASGRVHESRATA